MAQLTTFAITNVRVFDGERIRDPTTVFVERGRIAAYATVTVEIDGEGGVILPGLIDCHVHLHSLESVEQLCRWGVTTALDMGAWPHDLVNSLRQQSVKLGLTEIRSAGVPATAPGSLHSHIPGLPAEALVTDASEAAVFVANRVSEGSDYIKIIADTPGPDQRTLNALVSAAREQEKATVAHAASYGATAMAQEAQVDVLTHVPLDRALDDAMINRMKADNRIVIPTLTMMEGVVKAMKRPGMDYSTALDSVSAMYAAKIPILAGTDANSTPGVPANIPHGQSIHRELELLVDAGMSTLDALRAATTVPATYFGLDDRGVIEPGRRADLVLISGNPLEDIRATSEVRRVWCGGVEFQPTGMSTCL